MSIYARFHDKNTLTNVLTMGWCGYNFYGHTNHCSRYSRRVQRHECTHQVNLLIQVSKHHKLSQSSGWYSDSFRAPPTPQLPPPLVRTPSLLPVSHSLFSSQIWQPGHREGCIAHRPYWPVVTHLGREKGFIY